MYTIEIPVEYSEIVILTHILKGYHRLADLVRETGFTKTRVLRTISRIKERWRIGVDIDFHKIGLNRAVLLLKKTPKTLYNPYFIAAINKSIEGYTIVSYHLPVDHGCEDLVKLYNDVVIECYLFNRVYFPRPDLAKYYNNGRLVVNIPQLVAESLENASFESPETGERFVRRFTILDIKILDILSKNAFISAKRIAEKLGESVSKINNHLRMLRNLKVFRGYFIRRYPIEPIGKPVLGAIFILDNDSLAEADGIARCFQRIPLFGASYVSDDGMVLLQLSVREKMLRLLPVISSIMRTKADVTKTLIVSPLRAVRRTPEKKTYSKYEKNWMFSIS